MTCTYVSLYINTYRPKVRLIYKQLWDVNYIWIILIFCLHPNIFEIKFCFRNKAQHNNQNKTKQNSPFGTWLGKYNYYHQSLKNIITAGIYRLQEIMLTAVHNKTACINTVRLGILGEWNTDKSTLPLESRIIPRLLLLWALG